MIKCKCTIDSLSYKDFNKLKNIERVNPYKNDLNKLYKGDIFECDRNIAKYLLGDNDIKKCVIEVIEIIPNEKDQ